MLDEILTCTNFVYSQVKTKFEVDEMFDCSNENDIHRVVIHSAVFTAVHHARNDVIDLDPIGINKNNAQAKYCQWFFCRTNPECGQSSSATNNFYKKFKDNIGCDDIDTLSCNQCVNEQTLVLHIDFFPHSADL